MKSDMSLGYPCVICYTHDRIESAYCGMSVNGHMYWLCKVHFDQYNAKSKRQELVRVIKDYEQSS